MNRKARERGDPTCTELVPPTPTGHNSLPQPYTLQRNKNENRLELRVNLYRRGMLRRKVCPEIKEKQICSSSFGSGSFETNWAACDDIIKFVSIPMILLSVLNRSILLC
ncbi:hypothetical protein JTB14_011213 [Gonioctena quinquepunctata]|nr:hypothetical protein JTB14_011213 [Gonioctena quinquepunctata]